MKNCKKQLKELIEYTVLPDIEDQMDIIFEQIAKEKKANDELQNQIDELQEMRTEFQEIVNEIDENQLEYDECTELYEEIMSMLPVEEEE